MRKQPAARGPGGPGGNGRLTIGVPHLPPAQPERAAAYATRKHGMLKEPESVFPPVEFEDASRPSSPSRAATSRQRVRIWVLSLGLRIDHR